MSFKDCRWVSYVLCLVFAACSEITVYEAQAGGVYNPPFGGGSVQLNTSYRNYWGAGDGGLDKAEGWGNVFGGVVPDQMFGNIFLTTTGDPVNPGNVAVNFQFDGRQVSQGDPLTDQMLFVAQNPLMLATNYYINRVTFDGGFITYDPALQVRLEAQANFYYNNMGDRMGVINSRVSVLGGVITNSFGEVDVNDWSGPGPRPDWLPPILGNETWGVQLTTPGEVHYTPEPSGAAVMTLLGLSALGFRRR